MRAIITLAFSSAFAQTLVFSPASLALQYAKGSFNVSLSSQPTSEYTVSFVLDGFQFDKCSLKFTTDNWNKPQEVNVVVPPSFSSSTTPASVSFQLCGNSTVQKYTITPSPLTLSNCVATGDPHFCPFHSTSCGSLRDDRNNYFDFQGTGSYYLFNSQKLTIV